MSISFLSLAQVTLKMNLGHRAKVTRGGAHSALGRNDGREVPSLTPVDGHFWTTAGDGIPRAVSSMCGLPRSVTGIY